MLTKFTIDVGDATQATTTPAKCLVIPFAIASFLDGLVVTKGGEKNWKNSCWLLLSSETPARTKDSRVINQSRLQRIRAFLVNDSHFTRNPTVSIGGLLKSSSSCHLEGTLSSIFHLERNSKPPSKATIFKRTADHRVGVILQGVGAVELDVEGRRQQGAADVGSRLAPSHCGKQQERTT